MPDLRSRQFFGIFLLGAIVAAGILGISRPGFGATGQNLAQVGNAAPVISGFAVNNGVNVTLIPNSTTTVTVNYVVTDDNGCGSVFYSGNVTSTFYRSGVSSTCAIASPTQSLLSCYVVATTTHNCPGANSTTTSANVTTTFQVWYFADSTSDTSTASSTYPSNNWLAYASARDSSSTIGASSSATGVEINVLLAINVATSTLNYGTMAVGTNTSGTNQVSSVKNAGNASSGLQVSGSALSSGANAMPTSSQHYATNTFTYGGVEQQLQSAATAVGGWVVNLVSLPGTWATTTPLPYMMEGHQVVSYGDYVYAIGGDNVNGETSTVVFASFGATGTLSAWATTTPLPNPRTWHRAERVGQYIYVVGGCTTWGCAGTATTTILYAPINATGSLGSWATTTAYPKSDGIAFSASFSTNGRIYVIAGGGNAEMTSTVRFAEVGVGGSLGAWTSTIAYPHNIESHEAVLVGDRIYVLYGNVDSIPSSATQTIRYATVNATGSLGTWTSTAATPAIFPLYRPAVVADSDIIYALGGEDMTPPSAASPCIDYAPVLSAGGVGPWSETCPFPENIGPGTASVVRNGIIYTIGGYSGVSEIGSVYHLRAGSRPTYWGLGTPSSTPAGTYAGTVTYTAVYSP